MCWLNAFDMNVWDYSAFQNSILVQRIEHSRFTCDTNQRSSEFYDECFFFGVNSRKTLTTFRCSCKQAYRISHIAYRMNTPKPFNIPCYRRYSVAYFTRITRMRFDTVQFSMHGIKLAVAVVVVIIVVIVNKHTIPNVKYNLFILKRSTNNYNKFIIRFFINENKLKSKIKSSDDVFQFFR